MAIRCWKWVYQSLARLSIMIYSGIGKTRRLRHALMDMSSQLEHQDFVVIARKGVETLSYQTFIAISFMCLKNSKSYIKDYRRVFCFFAL